MSSLHHRNAPANFDIFKPFFVHAFPGRHLGGRMTWLSVVEVMIEIKRSDSGV